MVQLQISLSDSTLREWEMTPAWIARNISWSRSHLRDAEAALKAEMVCQQELMGHDRQWVLKHLVHRAAFLKEQNSHAG